MLIALFFVTIVSIAGFAILLKSSNTSFAWGNLYADTARFKNCYCHNGDFIYTRANNGISGPDVRFLGQLTEQQCDYDCWKAGYEYFYWERPVSIARI